MNIQPLPVLAQGSALKQAHGAMIMIHGRGSSGDDILGLAQEWQQSDWAWLAPQAHQGTWYPQRFTAPLSMNEPWLSAALDYIDAVVNHVHSHGIPTERTILLGFSQGACLALEYAARFPKRYGAIIGLSGGLIGPAGTTWNTNGDLQQTPVFLGCSDRDAHIPRARVHESVDIFEQLNASVTERIYPGMGHTINQDEIEWIRSTLATI